MSHRASLKNVTRVYANRKKGQKYKKKSSRNFIQSALVVIHGSAYFG